MARAGTLVLDSEGLSKVVADDRQVMALLRGAEQEDMRVIVSVLTLIEAHHRKVNAARFNWVVSRLTVEPVSEEIGRSAMKLLTDARPSWAQVRHRRRRGGDCVADAEACGDPHFGP